MGRMLGYVRCSTQEQGESGLSLDAQTARITAWCDAAGVDLAEIIEDKGVSGARALADRPGGSRVAALLDSRSADVDALIVLRLDRLGRDAAETLHLLKRFKTSRVGLVSITERLDLSTPQGRAMAGISAVFAELERGLIGQRTAEALRVLRSAGRIYGPLPFGFDDVDGMLVRNRDEQRTLACMRELRDCGHSYAVIADRLNACGVRSKRGGIWHAMSVRSVLLTSQPLEPQPS